MNYNTAHEVQNLRTGKRGEKMTKNKRCSIMITPEIEDKIREMRKTDEYCMLPVSEIIRRLVNKGLNAIQNNEAQ